MSKLVQIMRTLRSMPPLPDVASRILAIVRNPEYSIDGLVAVVRTDPALTTRILKLCNSSMSSRAPTRRHSPPKPSRTPSDPS